jgi:pentatricopeptide repeat protein
MLKTIPAELDVTAWNAIISAHALQGDWDKAHKLFTSMLDQNTKPDAITFTLLLISASHSGKVAEAVTLYNNMHQQYGVPPNITHQTVLVDVLSRSGKLRDAVEFIETHISEPSIKVCVPHRNSMIVSRYCNMEDIIGWMQVSWKY